VGNFFFRAFAIIKSISNFITNRIKITEKSFTDEAFLSLSVLINLLPTE
jgi:hypothetical protein